MQTQQQIDTERYSTQVGDHKVFIHTLLNDNYGDCGQNFIYMGARPMVGDVILVLEGGYGWQNVIIDTLILIKENHSSNQKICFWHAYCTRFELDFSKGGYYGEKGDIPKLAAHALDQRTTLLSFFDGPPSYENEPEDWRDLWEYRKRIKEEYEEICRQDLKDRIDKIKENKR